MNTAELRPHNLDEKRLYQWLRLNVKEYGGHTERIENSIGSGMPDVMVIVRGVVYFVELKMFVKEDVLLRKMQYAWGMKHHKLGGRPMVLAWNMRQDRIVVWRFPLEVKVKGKYLAIQSEPSYSALRILEGGVDLSQIFPFTIEKNSV